MNVVVTGGAGFIGSWLCDRLIENGHRVICIDNLSSGSKENFQHLLRHKRFKFIERDVRDLIGIKGPVECVFHLASKASPIDFREHAIDILLTNSLGTLNMLELARKKKARFLLASTSEVYGDPKEHPQRESYWGNVNPVGVRSCYDESKRFAEALTMAYHRKYGLDVRIARIFNTFGPRMRRDDGRAVPNFIVQALEDRPITVYGDGTQTRSFCYITDLVEGLVRLATTDALGGEIVNLGNPQEVSILEVANLIKKLAGSRSRMVFKPLPQDDPVRRKPDISKAKEILRWKPVTPLREGLQATIEYFRKILKVNISIRHGY